MALTDDEEKALRALLGKGDGSLDERVNGAVGARLTRFAEKDLPEKIAAGLKPIAETLDKIGGKGKGDDKGGKGKGDESVDVESEVEKRVRAHLKKIDDERAAERADVQRKEERAELQRVLIERGMDPKRAKGAVALLHGDERRIKRDGDGNIVFTVERGSGSSRYSDELSLSDGVAAWLDTDDGKSYLPPKGARGSGSAPANKTTPAAGGSPFGTKGADGKVDPAARRTLARQTLAAALDFDPGAEDDGE